MPKDQPWALVTFCVETAEGVPAIVQRLKHDKANMVRARPDGSKLTWQVSQVLSSWMGCKRGDVEPFAMHEYFPGSLTALTASALHLVPPCSPSSAHLQLAVAGGVQHVVPLPWLQVGAMHNFEEPSRKCKPFFINWDDPSIRPDKVNQLGPG